MITFRITDAGWAAWQAADADGTDKVTIAEIGFGDDGHAIDDIATGLVSERARVGAAGGQNIAPLRIHVTAIEDGAQDYTIREIGLFLTDGTLFAQWSDPAETAGNKVALVPYVMTVDIAFDDLPDGAVEIAQTDISFPPATETIAGRIEIATQAETDAGTDDSRAVTPAKLAGFSATVERRGMVELASGAETRAGSDNSRAVTPQALATLTASNSRRGLIEIATQAEVDAGSSAQLAVTPQTLAEVLAGISTPLASTEQAGRIEIATQSEVDAGTAGNLAVTPETLAAILADLDATVGTGGIEDEAVTMPKLQHIGTQTLLGRQAAGTGDVEILTAADARGILNVEDGATADQTGGEIKTAYEGQPDTNALTDARRDTVDHISVSAATDLDAIRSRVNELDAAVVLVDEWDASSGLFPGGGSAQPGHGWLVSIGGTVDGVEFSDGDRVIALVDNASQNTYASNWVKADYSDRVSTVHGRTGNVAGQSGDYDAGQITETPSAKIMTAAERDAIAASVPGSRQVGTGAGLAGGGALTSDLTIELSPAAQSSLSLADSAVQPADLGTIASQDANDVNISGVFGTLGGNSLSSNIVRAGHISDRAEVLRLSEMTGFGAVSSGFVITASGDLLMLLDSGGLNFYTAGGARVASYGPGNQGTFTPTTAGPSFTTQRGRYQVIGNRVHVSIYLGWSSSGSESMVISGLPFSPALDDEGLTIGYRGTFAFTTDPDYQDALRAFTNTNGTIEARGCKPDGSDTTHNFAPGGGEVMISGSYEIDVSAL